MEHLYTTKTVIPGATQKCGICYDLFTTPAVKCDQCNQYVHLKCSRMPKYMAIKYFTSRVHYTCAACIEEGTDNYQAICDWMDSVGVPVTGESHVTNDLTGESLDNSTAGETRKHACAQQNNDQITGIALALAELIEQVSRLTSKINKKDENEPPNYPGGGKTAQTSTKNHVNKPRPEDSSSTYYADAVAKANYNQHVVFIKPKDLTTPSNNEEIISTLKHVPTVTARNTQQKAMKLVFPSEPTKDQAIEALEANNQIADTHQIICEKKLKPKICITFIPEQIEDSEIVQSIQDKNENIKNVMNEETDMKLLFTKPSTPGYKTAVITVTPRIRKIIENNDNRVYLHMSRCRAYDHYWVIRCGKCTKYGHKTTNCHATEPVCGHCAQTHLSNTCTNKHLLKCHHCLTNKREVTDHSSFSTQCPTFIQAKQNVIRRTIRWVDEETVTKN